MANLPYWLVGIIAGVASALLYASASTGNLLAMMLLYVTPLPLFIAGLGWGTLTALIAGVAGAVMMALFGGISAGIVYFAVAALGPIILTRFALLSRPVGGSGAAAAARAARAREAHHRAVAEGEADGPPPAEPEPQVEWYPAGRLVVWMTSIAAALLALTVVSMMGSEGGIRGAVFQMLNTGIVDTGELGNALKQQGLDISPTEFLHVVSGLVPGLTAALWVMLTLVNMAVAQIVLDRSDRNLRPTPSLSFIDYPKPFALLLPASLLLSLVPGEIGFAGLSLAAVFFAPYFLLGLAVIHAISRGWQGRTPLLVAVYVLLGITGWVGLLIGIIGIAEPFADLRARFAPPPEKTG